MAESKNRQEEKARARAVHDFKVNLKAELEVRLLHDKLDYLVVSQMKRLLEFQQIEIDMLRDLMNKASKP
ncbi:MAG: DUF1003 domain-containing protein [Fimbriimonadaceae bacterium]|nr:DUF1003 domain-containing protein [Fimbriimonadaceae bacterium]QYK56732.1 MAG: DUF1003 domain-containing protein [Fimbriimonadaceae bacterium]